MKELKRKQEQEEMERKAKMAVEKKRREQARASSEAAIQGGASQKSEKTGLKSLKTS